MYSSAIDANGKLGANESCWKVVYGPACAVANATSSSACDQVLVLSTGVCDVSGVCAADGGELGIAGSLVDTTGSAPGATDTPILMLTFVSSSSGPGGSVSNTSAEPDRISRALLLAALRSANPILTSRTLTVAGSSPNTFCANTRKTSTRSSP